MMTYGKTVVDGYIVAYWMNSSGRGGNITAQEYKELQEVSKNRPHKDGYDYRLKADLTWEEYEVPMYHEVVGEGTPFVPYEYNVGDVVESGRWYAEYENGEIKDYGAIYECIKDGVPKSITDSEFFEVNV